MMIEGEPYFLKNKEWYIVNEGIPKFLGGTVERYYTLTDKAPKEAIKSYRKFYKDLSSGGIYMPVKKKRNKSKPLVDDNIKKHLKIMHLLQEVDDLFVHRFFDLDSDEMLDEKIEVLTALKNGKVPAEIPNYFKILENYPKGEEMWDI